MSEGLLTPNDQSGQIQIVPKKSVQFEDIDKEDNQS